MTHKEIIKQLNEAMKKLNAPDIKNISATSREISNEDFIKWVGVKFGVRSVVYLPQVGVFTISMN